jgi:hypothetical protein
MRRAVFLSASVPDPRKSHFVGPSDIIDVVAAVRALVYVVLGRRPFVWGGHPAITPMVWSVAESLGVSYPDWVRLYQSQFFEERYPEDNKRFKNTRYVPATMEAPGQSEEERLRLSLHAMRSSMFVENVFETAVFIGGMRGVVDEFDLFGHLCPYARRIPVLSTGGATPLLLEGLGPTDLDIHRLQTDIDYVPLFYDLCQIDPAERRGRIS